MNDWASDGLFYHIYPLGLTGAPQRNDFTSAPVPRLAEIHDWIGHMCDLGVNALYLGPLFESSAHGYDTADFFRVDRRLGDAQTLADLSQALHAAGIRLILDGVFHHVGRDFWAFRDLQAHGPNSAYRDWFVDVDFSRPGPAGDSFSYAGWNGHYDLVKLNLSNPEVRSHLFDAVREWFARYDIDGLRLDVAEIIDPAFLRDLAALCRELRPDAWLVGEQIHGDYRRMTDQGNLDSATNYEVYKGLYSSLNDGNYFEIAYALNRQFGSGGIYRNTSLFNFVDNHDVARVASILKNPAHLYPLYALLLTMPGVPAIYYGSEWGITGVKNHDDWPLRPRLTPDEAAKIAPQPDLPPVIARLAALRHELAALRHGDYKQLHVANPQFAFARSHAGEQVIVALNADQAPASLAVPVDLPAGTTLRDALNPGDSFTVQNGRLELSVAANWARVLVTA